MSDWYSEMRALSKSKAGQTERLKKENKAKLEQKKRLDAYEKQVAKEGGQLGYYDLAKQQSIVGRPPAGYVEGKDYLLPSAEYATGGSQNGTGKQIVEQALSQAEQPKVQPQQGYEDPARQQTVVGPEPYKVQPQPQSMNPQMSYQKPQGTYTADTTRKNKVLEVPAWLENKSQQQTSTAKKILYGSAAVAASFTKGIVYDLPVGTLQFVRQLQAAKEPLPIFAALSKPFETGSKIGEFINQNPGQALGQGASIVAAPRIYSIAGTKVTDVVNKIGMERVAPESVFSEQVLVEGQTFPTTKGPSDSLARFAAAKEGDALVGSHATTAWFGKETVIKPGPMAKAGREDAGLYITPKGEGSPHFLGVSGETEYVMTLNPFKNIGNKPNVVNVKYDSINLQPSEVIGTSGFGKVNEFLASEAGTGKAFITKRSTIGQTGEIEAVIPQEQLIVSEVGGNWYQNLRGYKSVTEYNGRTIPIRDFTAVKSEVLLGKTVSQTEGIPVYKGKSSGSSYKPNVKYATPYKSGLQLVSRSPELIVQDSSGRYGIGAPSGRITAPSRPVVESPSSKSIVSSSVASSGSSPATPSPAYSPLVSPSKATKPSGPSRPSGSSSIPSVVEPSVQPQPSYVPSPTPQPNRPSRPSPILSQMPPPPPPPSYFGRPGSNRKGTEQGFNVFVRVKGLFQKVNTDPLARTEAMDYGITRVGTTAAASFKILPSATQVISKAGPRDALAFTTDFYKKDDTFIEKRERRIKSAGELQEITFKGIAARKGKALKFGRVRL